MRVVFSFVLKSGQVHILWFCQMTLNSSMSSWENAVCVEKEMQFVTVQSVVKEKSNGEVLSATRQDVKAWQKRNRLPASKRHGLAPQREYQHLIYQANSTTPTDETLPLQNPTPNTPPHPALVTHNGRPQERHKHRPHPTIKITVRSRTHLRRKRCWHSHATL